MGGYRPSLGSLGLFEGFRHSFVELDVERGVGRRLDVVVDARNNRYAFARRCADSPLRVIDEQYGAVEHDELGPCRRHVGFRQRRGNIDGVESGCAASRCGSSGDPWTVRRDVPRLRGRALATRSHRLVFEIVAQFDECGVAVRLLG